MQHRIHRSWNLDIPRHIVLRKTEPGIRKQVGDIGTRPSDEVIHAKHVPALLDEEIAEVGTQESRPASDHRAQFIRPFRLPL
jgi:hypothetical protein